MSAEGPHASWASLTKLYEVVDEDISVANRTLVAFVGNGSRLFLVTRDVSVAA